MGLTTKPLSLKVNAALFDVDGTIIISQPAIAAFWRISVRTNLISMLNTLSKSRMVGERLMPLLSSLQTLPMKSMLTN